MVAVVLPSAFPPLLSSTCPAEGNRIFLTGPQRCTFPMAFKVRALVQEAYNTAREILTTNVDELHVIADSLLRHETMTGKELEMAIQEHKESKRPVPNPAASFLAQTAAVST